MFHKTKEPTNPYRADRCRRRRNFFFLSVRTKKKEKQSAGLLCPFTLRRALKGIKSQIAAATDKEKKGFKNPAGAYCQRNNENITGSFIHSPRHPVTVKQSYLAR